MSRQVGLYRCASAASVDRPCGKPSRPSGPRQPPGRRSGCAWQREPGAQQSARPIGSEAVRAPTRCHFPPDTSRGCQAAFLICRRLGRVLTWVEASIEAILDEDKSAFVLCCPLHPGSVGWPQGYPRIPLLRCIFGPPCSAPCKGTKGRGRTTSRVSDSTSRCI